MFGLMTVAEHQKVMREAEEFVVARAERAIAKAESDAEGWRFLATKLAGDLVDLRKRETPEPPSPEDAATLSIADGDAEATPSAVQARKRKSTTR